MNSSENLSLIEANLRKPDAVLEPGVLEEIVKAIAAGGRPESLVECLSDGYVGLPQMCNLLCSWLPLIGLPGGKGPTTMRGATSSTHQHRGQEDASDTYFFLKELVNMKFSAEKLAGVFSQYGGKPPPWMEMLCEDARGRKLIYELSATHRNCLLLDYGIQRILKMGHEDEVAQVGASLASYFSVFHRLLTTRLRAMALTFLPSSNAESETSKIVKKLGSLSTDLVESCGKSAHTYFLAQLLLSNLSTHPRYGSIFRRASQDLEAAAAKYQPSIWLSMSLFAPQGLSMKALAALQEVGEIIASGSVAPSRLEHLLLMYQGSPDNLGPIQHPAFIGILIATVFTPVMKANAQVSGHQLNAIHLLAIASTRRESNSLGNAAGGSKADYQADRRLNSTKEGLQSALALVVRIQGGKISNDDVTLFARISKIPLVCYGFFYYFKILLGQREFFQWSEANATAQVGLRIVTSIATRKGQTDFLMPALEVIDVTIMALGSQFQDLTKMFLEACVVILRERGSMSFTRIREILDRWAKEADPSLVRHLVVQLLTHLAPPYSSTFASWMIHLSMVSGIKKRGHVGPSSGVGGHTITLLLQEFASVCQNGVKFDPPLASKELALLAELKSGPGQSVGLRR